MIPAVPSNTSLSSSCSPIFPLSPISLICRACEDCLGSWHQWQPSDTNQTGRDSAFLQELNLPLFPDKYQQVSRATEFVPPPTPTPSILRQTFAVLCSSGYPFIPQNNFSDLNRNWSTQKWDKIWHTLCHWANPYPVKEKVSEYPLAVPE